jgi:hypothetical protein
VGKPLGRLKCRYWDVNKMDITDVGWDCAERIYMIQDKGEWRADAKTVINLLVSQNTWNFMNK